MVIVIASSATVGWYSLRLVSRTKHVDDETRLLVNGNDDCELTRLDDTPVSYTQLLSDGPMRTILLLHFLSSMSGLFQQPLISNRLHELDENTTQT